MSISQLRSKTRYCQFALLLAWATLLFGGFAVGSDGIPTVARMGSSLVLVVAAWAWYGFVRSTPVSPYALLIAFGMTFGFTGDLFMANLMPVGDRMLGGMGAFGVGHACYITAFLTRGSRVGLTLPVARWSALAIWLTAGVVGWYLIVFPNAKPPALAWGALGYVLLLATAAGCASGLAVQARALWPLAVGAALFFISDLMIALGQFAEVHSKALDAAIWLTYGPAQALIVYSTAIWLGIRDRKLPVAAELVTPSERSAATSPVA
jgi:hypothetical protein